jgi:hypothetical protein
VSYLHDTYRLSERSACRVRASASLDVSVRERQEPRTALRLRIREIAQTRTRYGYRKIRVLLKLVYRLGGRLDAATQAATKASGGTASAGTLPAHGTRPGGVWISWPTSWPMVDGSEH